MGTQQVYSVYQDKRLRNVAKDMLIFCGIITVTGYIVRNLFEHFVGPSTSQITDTNFQKKMQIDKKYISEGVYKS